MEKSKKYNVHAIICPNCKGNGYIKLTVEEGREHFVAQCPECDSEGEIYVDESEVWSLISMLIILQIMMASCTRDLSPNPWTTVVRMAVQNDS